MKKILSKYLVTISALIATSYGYTSDVTQSLKDRQNVPNFQVSADSPLNNLSTYSFFPMFYSSSKAENDKTISSMLALLGKSCEIKKPDWNKSLDFSGLSSGASMIYQINYIEAINNAKPRLVRASLNIESSVTINKTKQVCSPYIWSYNVFYEGDLDADRERIINITLTELIGRFISDYKAANPAFNDKKPLLYFFAS